MMKKVFCVLLAAVLLFALVGCSHYTSHYNATKLSRTETSTHCKLSFDYLSGTYVHKFKAGPDTADALHIAAEMKEGSIAVYYDKGDNNGKQLLITLGADNPIDLHLGSVEDGQTAWIILEAQNASSGSIQVDIEKQADGGDFQ